MFVFYTKNSRLIVTLDQKIRTSLQTPLCHRRTKREGVTRTVGVPGTVGAGGVGTVNSESSVSGVRP